MSEQPSLFGDDPEPAPAAEPLSEGRRRTVRQYDMIQSRKHPLTRLPLHPQAPIVGAEHKRGEPFTCGSCVHRVIRQHNSKTVPKCDVDGGALITRSEATDVRAWWPACIRYEAEGDQ